MEKQYKSSIVKHHEITKKKVFDVLMVFPKKATLSYF